MENGKIALGVALGTLKLATAHAQPAPAPQSMVAPPKTPRVRATEPGKQITQDLLEFADALGSDKLFPDGQKWVYGARTGYFGANQWARETEFPLMKRLGFALQVDDIAIEKIAADSASATVTYSWTSPAGGGDERSKEQLKRERRETLALKLAGNPFSPGEKLWQIVPPETQPIQNSGDAMENQLSGVWANVSFVLAQKQPVSASIRARRSLQKLRQLGTGIAQLTTKYENRFAFAPEHWQEALSPYVRDKELFLVPDTLESYGFNANLSDKKLFEMPEPIRTVLFYEGENQTLKFRYDGRAAVCFADGHTALLSPDEAKNLIWKP